MRTFASSFTLSLVGALSVSCGSKSSSPESIPTELEGTWTAGCVKDLPDEPESQTSQETRRFEGSRFTLVSTYFLDGNCKSAALELKTEMTFGTGGAGSIAGSKNLDGTITAVFVTLKSGDIVPSYNTSKACGYSDWKAGEARDCTGKSLAGADDKSEPTKAGDKVYDIFKLESQTLYFGKSSEATGRTPETRAKELDQTRKFVRQN